MLYVKLDYIDATDEDRRFRVGEDAPFETRFELVGDLYRDCVREYGRCTSRVYVDNKEGSHPIGWVFVKRVPYDDDRSKKWLRETWVTMLAEPERKVVTTTYLETSSGKRVQVSNAVEN